jgi:hypothetical protein
MLSSIDDFERLRARAMDREAAISRKGGGAQQGFGRILGKITTASPAAGKFVLVQPQSIAGAETEGGTATIAATAAPKIAAYCLGPAVPMQNDLVVIHRVGWRWVFERGGNGCGTMSWTIHFVREDTGAAISGQSITLTGGPTQTTDGSGNTTFAISTPGNYTITGTYQGCPFSFSKMIGCAQTPTTTVYACHALIDIFVQDCDTSAALDASVTGPPLTNFTTISTGHYQLTWCNVSLSQGTYPKTTLLVATARTGGGSIDPNYRTGCANVSWNCANTSVTIGCLNWTTNFIESDPSWDCVCGDNGCDPSNSCTGNYRGLVPKKLFCTFSSNFGYYGAFEGVTITVNWVAGGQWQSACLGSTGVTGCNPPTLNGSCMAEIDLGFGGCAAELLLWDGAGCGGFGPCGFPITVGNAGSPFCAPINVSEFINLGGNPGTQIRVHVTQ